MFKKFISESEILPKDISRDAPVAMLSGKEQLKIQNFDSLLKYGPDEIVIRMKKQRMRVQGHALDIQYYNADELCVRGCIESITYMGG